MARLRLAVCGGIRGLTRGRRCAQQRKRHREGNDSYPRYPAGRRLMGIPLNCPHAHKRLLPASSLPLPFIIRGG